MDWIGKSKNHLHMLIIEFHLLNKPTLSIYVCLKMLLMVLDHCYQIIAPILFQSYLLTYDVYILVGISIN